MVEDFEREFAQFCDAKYCVGVNSGTDALRFAFLAAGIGPGDIVLTVPHTFIATTEAISQTGAAIAFVDIDEQTYTLDPLSLREYIEKNCDVDAKSGHLIERVSKRRVAAVVPVHLYGQTADMDPILDIASTYNLVVIEDACQAHGAEYFSKQANAWKKAGSMGRAAAFSFYPGKNLGACGEGGAITTNDEAMSHQMRMIRDHGQAKKYYHDVEGYNGRLDSIQAGWLSVKLRHLAQWNEARRNTRTPLSPTVYRVKRFHGPSGRSAVDKRRVSPLCGAHTGSRSLASPPNRCRDRLRYSLPYSPSSAKSLCASRLQEGLIPRYRAHCRGNRLPAHLSATSAGPASFCRKKGS